jgi:hypothetical protein
VRVEQRDRPLFYALCAITTLLALLFLFVSAEGDANSGRPANSWGLVGNLWDWIAKDSISFFTAFLAVATAALVFTARRQITLMERAEATSAKLTEVSERQMLQAGMQTEILEKQKEIQRQEFLTTHRPDLIVREAVRDEEEEKFSFLLVNRGSAPCIVVQSLIMLRSDVDDIPAVFDVRGHNDIGEIKLAAGEFKRVDIQPKSEGEEVAQVAFELGFLETYGMRGVVVYEDDGGVRRRMVFARHLPKGQTRFRRTGNPDDEYTD